MRSTASNFRVGNGCQSTRTLAKSYHANSYLLYEHCLNWLTVWCSGNTLVSINAVALHRARLVLGWVTAFGR